MSLRRSRKLLEPCLILLVAAGVMGFTSMPAPALGRGGAAMNLVHRAANAILQHCRSDGAITQEGVGVTPDTPLHIVPYCANLAAIGLVSAYKVSQDSSYLDAAKSWAIWYENHIDPNGVIEDFTGQPGDWCKTGDYDSSDSYAATWLDLVWRIDCAGAGKEWLIARWPSIEKIREAMALTRQSNGLTWAKPTYPVEYTMDSVETRRGIEALERIARALGHVNVEKYAAEWNRQSESSIEKLLWDAETERYQVGLQSNGAIFPSGAEWYPSTMANLMAIAWLPKSEKRVDLYARMRAVNPFPQSGQTNDDVGHIVWWLMAAKRVGNAKDTTKLGDLLEATPPSVWNSLYPDVLGHICRGLDGLND